MSKGWTRRPSLVDRKAYDQAYEACFHVEHTSSITSGPEINGSTEPRSGDAPPLGVPTSPRKRPSLDACEIAQIMTSGPEEGFGDKWCEA